MHLSGFRVCVPFPLRSRSLLVMAFALSVVTALALVPSVVHAQGSDSDPGEVLGVPGSEDLGPEVPHLRTEESRTYRHAERGLVVQVYPEAVNFRNEQGRWQAVDERLVRRGEGFGNRAGGVDVDVPGDAGGWARASQGEHWVAFALQGAGGSAEVRGPSATYRDALEGVDVRFTARGDGLKEDLIVSGAEAPTTFTYALRVSPGLKPVEATDGGMSFVDGDGREVASFLPAFMEDEAVDDTRGFSDEVGMSLQDGPEGYAVTLTADAEWVRSSRRRGLVTIDPTVSFTPASPDCKIANGADADTSYCGAANIDVGSSRNADGSVRKRRSLLRFTIERWLPRGAEVFYAQMLLRANDQSTGEQIDVDLHDVSRSWTSQATWNSHDGTNAWGSGGGDFEASPVLSRAIGGALGWYGFDVTSAVQGWADRAADGGNNGGHGLLLKQADEEIVRNDIDFASSQAPGEWPMLRIWYDNLAGDLPYYSFDGESLTDRLAMQVNLASGNLMLQENDLAVSGTGLDLDLARFYNAREPVTDHQGWGWTWSGGKDNRLVGVPGGVVFAGPSGYVKFFKRKTDGSGGYVKPPGVNATLIEEGGTRRLKWNESEEVWRFSSAGRMVEQEDRNGHKVVYGYDANGRMSQVTDTQGRVTRFGYGANGRIATMTDSSGRVHRYEYNAERIGYEASPGIMLTKYTDPAGGVTRYEYGGEGGSELVAVIDPMGRKTAFDYDNERRITSVTRGITGTSGGDRTTYAYAYSRGQSACPSETVGRTTVTDPRGNPTLYCWDGQGRVDRVFDVDGHEQNRKFDPRSNVTFEQGQLGAAAAAGGYGVNSTFDSDDNLTSIEQPGPEGTTGAGATDTFTYDGFRLDEGTDANGKQTAYSYDGPGNLRGVAAKRRETDGSMTDVPLVDIDLNGDSTAQCTTITSDTGPAGTVRCTKDGNGQETRYDYDARGNLTKRTPPSPVSSPLGATSYTYDSLSRPVTQTDGKGQKRTFAYDTRDRVTRVEFFRADGTKESEVSYSYDAAGNLTERSDVSGTTRYDYDARNRLTEQDYPSQPDNRYSYDAVGNLTAFSDGGGTTLYAYASDNTVRQLTAPNGTTTTFDHDDDGQLTRIGFPNGVAEAMTYDRAGRVKTIKATKGATVLTDFSYDYGWTKPQGDGESEGSLIQSMKDGVRATTTAYEYDHLGRLTLARATRDADGTTAESYSYRYDPASNRLEASDTSSTPQRSYAYNEADQLCWVHEGSSANGCSNPPTGATTYQYDRNGNTISSSDGYRFFYNAQNQTTAITPPNGPIQHMAYRDVGQSEITQRGSAQFSTSLLGLMSGAYAHYVRAPDGRLLLSFTGGTWYSFHHDAHPGSVAATADANGDFSSRHNYDPFGNATVERPYSDEGFAGGHYHHELGLYKFGERWYDPKLGRWTQQDPLHQPIDPRNANAYMYAGQDPVNLTDPTGEAAPVAIAVAVVIRAGVTRATAGQAARTAGATLSSGAYRARSAGYRYTRAKLDKPGSTELFEQGLTRGVGTLAGG